MNKPERIAVIGGGSWATAIVKLLCNNQEKVNWWMRSEESVAHILHYKHNPKYLQSIEFDSIVFITSKQSPNINSSIL